MYDHTTLQGATFNMRGQLYRGHANATALFSSPVVSALGSELDDLGSSPGRGKALCPWDVWALLLGLAKSIYYCLHIPLDKTCKHHLHMKGQMQWKLTLCFPVSIGLLPVKWFFWKNQISFLCIPLFKLFIKHFVFFWNIIQDIK